MSLRSVHEKIMLLKRTSSTNDKVSLLKEYLKNELFSAVIQYMYDEIKQYNINKLPKKQKPSIFLANSQSSTKDIFDFLDVLSKQRGASNEDKQKLSRLASIDDETFEVVKWIINKDAKAGFGGKLINKAKPGFVYLMPYCRCSTAEKKMHTIDFSKGVLFQEKADGIFVNIIVDKEGEVTLKTRNGRLIYQLDHIVNHIKNNIGDRFKNTVYMGELLIKKDGKILPRAIGNGYLNSCMQETCDPEIAKLAIGRFWDAVPLKDFEGGVCLIPYENRLSRVAQFINDIKGYPLFELIYTKRINSEQEANVHYKTLRRMGKEGGIVKTRDAIWKFHTSPNQVKMKNTSVAELRITGWKHGKEDTKFEDIVGSVQCQTDDGLVEVSFSGLTDEDRIINWDEQIGNIVSVKYEGLITSKSRKDIYSLYLPRFDDLRPDRNDTDTLEDLKTR